MTGIDIVRALIGKTLNNRYDLARFLGAGGMGVVLEGYDRYLQRAVAVKFVRPEVALNERAVEAFITEARTVAALEHPNIIPIYDIGAQTLGNQTVVYQVMQLAASGNLADRLKNNPLTYTEILALLGEVCSALDYAHSRGVVHLDLKPLNILFTADEKPIIADFGFAQILEEVTGYGYRASGGTPAYMAPEQYLGIETRTTSDIFALGVSLYEMITGQLPWRGSEGEIEFHIPIRQTPLMSVVQRATNYIPAQRYRTATSFLQDLENAIGDTTGSAESGSQARAEKFLARGKDAFEAARYEDAVSALTRVLEVDPTNIEALKVRGQAYCALFQYSAGMRDFEHALQLDPTDSDAYKAKGNLHMLQGQRTAALETYSAALRLDPTLVDLYRFRAAATYAMAHYQAEGEEYTKLVQQAIDDYESYLALGGGFMNGDHDQILQVIKMHRLQLKAHKA